MTRPQLISTLFPYTTLFRSGQGEMPVGEQQSRTQRLLDRLDDRVRGPAMRALEIAIFDELELRPGGPLGVIPRPQGRCEPAHGSRAAPAPAGCALCSSAPSPPSAPGFFVTSLR